MSITSDFLSKYIETKDWQTVNEKQITNKFFNGVDLRVFKWVNDFKLRYGTMPSKEVVQSKFPEFQFSSNCTEPLSFYCDEVRNMAKHNALVDVVTAVTKDLNDFKADEGYKKIAELLRRVQSDIIMTDTCDIGENTEERYSRYEERKRSGGISGIPIGILPIDKQLGGIKPIDLVTFLGYTGTGKTWLLCLIGVAMAMQGFKVLFLTKEMLPSQIIDRIDAIWANISYSRLKDGNLEPQEEQRYLKYLREEAPRHAGSLEVELVEGGVISCGGYIDKHSPDICLIDGGYLMADDSDDNDWKGILEVWRGFKALARNRKVPIICTTQLKAEKASLANISYVKALAQDCDAVYGLEQDEASKAEREIKIVTLKIRDGEWKPPFKMQWDFENMKHGLLYIEEEFSKPPIVVKKIERIDE